MAEYIMTDSEIIKALECCIKCDCKNCPANVDNKCRDIDYVKILNLINRQKEEIESLEKRELSEAMKFNSKTIAYVRAEAVKEFAKKLKHKAINIGVNDSIVSTYAIDNLLKEMESDNNAE